MNFREADSSFTTNESRIRNTIVKSIGRRYHEAKNDSILKQTVDSNTFNNSVNGNTSGANSFIENEDSELTKKLHRLTEVSTELEVKQYDLGLFRMRTMQGKETDVRLIRSAEI